MQINLTEILNKELVGKKATYVVSSEPIIKKTTSIVRKPGATKAQFESDRAKFGIIRVTKRTVGYDEKTEESIIKKIQIDFNHDYEGSYDIIAELENGTEITIDII